MVPVALCPPVTLEGEIPRLKMFPVLPLAPLSGKIVSGAETLFSEVAVIRAFVVSDTQDVDTGNVAWVCPAGTLIAGGTLAASELVDRATVAPPSGAAADRVTVPTAPSPE